MGEYWQPSSAFFGDDDVEGFVPVDQSVFEGQAQFDRVLNLMDADLKSLKGDVAKRSPIADSRYARRMSFGVQPEAAQLRVKLAKAEAEARDANRAVERLSQEAIELRIELQAMQNSVRSLEERCTKQAQQLAILTGKDANLNAIPLSELRKARSRLSQSLRAVGAAIDDRLRSLDTCVICQQHGPSVSLRACRQQHLTVCARCPLLKCPICFDAIDQKISR
ncbi:RING-type domain-containing protein [Plasmodiophora brassicae]|uniref:RING-type domain-containing protein n=1 Tax=Plasmodiophora brassicae TaxID=37360 RepID=A0A0G4J1V6_PLABS|nr:hypothetical protein PBRA_001930 [Plasmodiophora brassicae]SPR01351.1 unnamed protein product [Plasmodiophora brassicae]